MWACEKEIRKRIRERRQIPFAEFMRLALFHPKDGYYSSQTNIGASGDYFTSSTAHPVFGALIALQLQHMWEIMERPNPFYVVEMGAGTGLLAKDILRYVERLPETFRRSLYYVALEQRQTSSSQGNSKEYDFQPIVAQGVPLKEVVGCILSNELLDSFPVHRFQVQDGRLAEVYVALQGDAFKEVLGKPSTPLLEERSRSLGLTLSEGFRGEVNLEIDQWMAGIAQTLKRGFVLTIDYGYPAQELYSPQRSRGTLQCYYKHTQSGNPYMRIGEQDITAHVDFTSVTEAGDKQGLETRGLVTQREFLNNLGMGAFITVLRLKEMPQREYYANRMAMQELVKAEGLGNFKVLVQSKGINAEGLKLHGLTPENEMAREMEANVSHLEVPLLKLEHTPLMEGRYPHMAWGWQPPTSG